MVSGIAYGTIMEFIQEAWVANRSFELLDIAADGVGCLLAYWYRVRNFGIAGGCIKKIGPDGNRDRNQN